MGRYFLSYARADAPFALRLAEDLRAAGVDVWIDQIDIPPSRRWDRELEAALRASAGVIVILSPRSVASENVMDEVGFAIDQEKDVIPVLYQACEVPLRINRIQRIDFTGDYRVALERCASVLGVARATSQLPRDWDPEVLQRAERELTVYLGPIAPALVKRAAAESANADELYRSLASRLGDAGAREAFLKGAPSPNAPAASRFSAS